MGAGDFSKLRQRWRDERAARLKRSADLRRRLTERGLPILRDHGVRRVWLFGSVADGRAGPQSDIDLLAMPVDAGVYWSLRRELEAALEHRVDLYTQDDDAGFVRKVRQRGELIDAIQP